MPPGAPHHSFLGPYRIRVDDFSTPRDASFETPALQLLTHTHTDHITGLSAKSFGARVVCSIDAKHMLLNAEPAAARIAFDNEETTEKIRPYAHLKISPILAADGKLGRTHARDLLRALPLNTPVPIELSDGLDVTITLIDANHCPGAVMFLVEGSQGNFLHTGDVRAEPAFLASLARNPWLQRYIPPSASFFDPATSVGERPLRTLDAIYLDTACLLSYSEVPSKEEACAGLVKLISEFPSVTTFFINAWTWGYEDILKTIGRAFNCQVHVDRYKYAIYSGISDPSLKSIVTRDAESTRFHACERWNRCHQVEHGSAGVVYVNPVTMSKVQWELYLKTTHESLKRGEDVKNLICPLSRHSSLPELQALVKLFKPKLVVPNSLNPKLGNLDWACMPRMFSDFMVERGAEAIVADMRRANVNVVAFESGDPTLIIDHAEGEGVDIQNLIGNGAEELVKFWTGSTQTDVKNGDAVLEAAPTRSQHTWMKLRRFIGGSGQQQLTKRLDTCISSGWADSEDSDCDDAADARGRAAEALFAPTPPSSRGKAQALASKEIYRSSMPSKSPYSSLHRQSTLQRRSNGSKTQFLASSAPVASSSPFNASTSSITSLPTTFQVSSAPYKERLFHTLFDRLQFGTTSSEADASKYLRSRKEFQHPHVAILDTSPPTSPLGSPFPELVPPLPSKGSPNVLQLPFVSPSVTPSPHPPPCAPSSDVAISRTPVSDRTNKPQETEAHESRSPPMLDLMKVLKRTSTVAGLHSLTPKRKKTAQISPTSTSFTIPPLSPRPVDERRAAPSTCTARSSLTEERSRAHKTSSSKATGAILPNASRETLSHTQRVQLPQLACNITTSTSHALSPRSDAEKQRRREGKRKQIQIMMKLVRALPPDKVAPSCKAKVERRVEELAGRRARRNPTLISARDRMHVRYDAPSSSSLPLQRSVSTEVLQKNQGTVVDDEPMADWDRSKVYENAIKEQRCKGLRYPQLPRCERSFAESQSP